MAGYSENAPDQGCMPDQLLESMKLNWSRSQINKAYIKTGQPHRACYKIFYAKFIKWDICSIQKLMLDSCTRLHDFMGVLFLFIEKRQKNLKSKAENSNICEYL